jgi:ABC-type phosphate/phosphonate transport system substrate-binding protein
VQDGAFTMSHFSVVRALELGSVCDFGATYIDARAYPVLKNEYPHIMDDVIVVWQIPAIIPFDGLFLSSALPDEVRTKLRASLQQVALSGEGQRLLKSLYNMDAITPEQDVFYAEFVRYISVSGADWDSLVH